MKKPKFLNKFTLFDYLIVIVVIAAIIFAFIHITSDDQSSTESSSYDSSTLNKIVEKYLGYYNKGEIVQTSIEGLNSTNNEHVQLHGEIIWIDDDRGANVKILVKVDNETYLVGLYKDIPEADIYLEKMSLEVDGSKYNNLTEFKIKPANITSLGNLTTGLANYSNYEISSTITVDKFDNLKYQELNNYQYENGRISIKLSTTGLNERVILVRATSDDIVMADNILGSLNGMSEDITIRVYDCSLNEKQDIENNFDVINVKTY